MSKLNLMKFMILMYPFSSSIAYGISNTFYLKLTNPCTSYYSYHCNKSSVPEILNDAIYVSGYDGFLYVISKSSGEILKKYKDNGKADEYARSFSPVIYDQSVLIDGDNLYSVNNISLKLNWKYETENPSDIAIQNNVGFFGAKNSLNAIDLNSGVVKWAYNNDKFSFSTPVIQNGKIYVGSRGDYNSGSYFFALDAATGKLKWKFPGEDAEKFYASSCLTNHFVYFGAEKTVSEVGAKNHFYAVDMQTGNEQWSYANYDGFTTTPYCSSDTVFIGDDSEYHGTLYAFNALTGEIKWQFVAHGGFESSPNMHKGIIFVGNDDQYLYALDASTGKLKWKFLADSSVLSKPVIKDGIVYFTTKAGSLYAVNEETGE